MAALALACRAPPPLPPRRHRAACSPPPPPSPLCSRGQPSGWLPPPAAGTPPCADSAGIPGTDLAGGFQTRSDDANTWRLVANAAAGGGATGTVEIATSTDGSLGRWAAAPLHTYAWSRCVSLPAQCGFGPYPRDPFLFPVGAAPRDADADAVWVLAGGWWQRSRLQPPPPLRC